MVICKLLDLNLDDPTDHVSTTWEISEESSFRTTVVRSEDDTVNKEQITFPNLIPETSKTYYGRARIRTKSGGWSTWNNLDVMVAEKLDLADNTYTLPSRIGIPRLNTLDSGNVTNKESHPVIDFTIVADGYSTINNTKHIATSWYIETLDRDVIWKSEKNNVDLVSINIKSVLLKYENAYRIRCCFHSETNDTSDLSSLTVVTLKEKNIAIKSFLERVIVDDASFDITADNNLTMPLDPGVPRLYLDIVKYTATGESVVLSTQVTQGTKELNIPRNTLEYASNYLFKFKAEPTDPWEVVYYSTGLRP